MAVCEAKGVAGNENESKMEKRFFCPDYGKYYCGGTGADDQGAGHYETIALVDYG